MYSVGACYMQCSYLVSFLSQCSRAVINTTTVQLLRICGNGITSLEAPAISDMMTCLYISCNKLGDNGAVVKAKEIDGVIGIAEAITKNKTLKVLLLGGDVTLDKESAMIIMKNICIIITV